MHQNQLISELLSALKEAVDTHGLPKQVWIDLIERAEGQVLWDQYQAVLKRLNDADNLDTRC